MVRLSENVHGFYSYYCPVTVTSSAVVWLASDASSYRIYKSMTLSLCLVVSGTLGIVSQYVECVYVYRWLIPLLPCRRTLAMSTLNTVEKTGSSGQVTMVRRSLRRLWWWSVCDPLSLVFMLFCDMDYTFTVSCDFDCLQYSVMPISHRRHGQDQTVSSCPCRRCDLNWWQVETVLSCLEIRCETQFPVCNSPVSNIFWTTENCFVCYYFYWPITQPCLLVNQPDTVPENIPSYTGLWCPCWRLWSRH